MVWPWEKIWHVTPLRTTGCSEPANCYSFSRSAYTFWWSFNVVYLITSTWLLRYVWISMGSVRVYFIFSEKSHVKTFFFTWCFQKATESTCSEWGCSSEVNMQIFSSNGNTLHQHWGRTRKVLGEGGWVFKGSCPPLPGCRSTPA